MTDRNKTLSQRTTFSLGRPTAFFSQQYGLPDACWKGPGYYLMYLGKDEGTGELLGSSFDEAWAEVVAREAELEERSRARALLARKEEAARMARARAAERRRGAEDFFDTATSIFNKGRQTMSSLDGLLDEGVRRIQQFAEGVALGRELLRGDEAEDDLD